VDTRFGSYEGTFGVGYAVCSYTVTGEDASRNFLELYKAEEAERTARRRAGEGPYTALARLTLETYVAEGREINCPANLPGELTENAAGVFVSLKKYGQLRGCIGTISPSRENIAKEIIANAISAGTRDPRFPPVTEDELDALVYSVDVLFPPEPASRAGLDPAKYGVIVSNGYRRGLLLPNLEGVDTVERQLSIALQKGGIRPGEDYAIERFEVVRHT
jgi:AmmeMemoRadiSam system protein A